MLIGIPMMCSTRPGQPRTSGIVTVSPTGLQVGLLERALQRLVEGIAGQRGPADGVDVGALRLQDLLAQPGDGLMVNERRARSLHGCGGLHIRDPLALDDKRHLAINTVELLPNICDNHQELL